ncbi:MAG: hypothetical protein M0P71_01580 [Melioribacteraceae bacterium]|nr:hypothetical protein [Melioribacteraceae bacterium]
MKRARPIYSLGQYYRNRGTHKREEAISEDEEHSPLTRAKRESNLPDSWDTKKICRPKTWKRRCKKAKQWMKHFMTDLEKKFIRGE